MAATEFILEANTLTSSSVNKSSYILRSATSPSKAEKELGYSPKYNTSEMFRESYDWFINNYETINQITKGSAHKKPVKEALLSVFRWIS